MTGPSNSRILGKTEIYGGKMDLDLHLVKLYLYQVTCQYYNYISQLLLC